MVTLDDCAWHKVSRIFSVEEGLTVSREKLLAAKEMAGCRCVDAANHLLSSYRRDFWVFNSSSLADLRLGPRRARGVVIKPPLVSGKYYLLSSAEKSPGFYLREGVDSSAYDLYNGDLGVACLAGLLSEGWKVINNDDIMPGDSFGSDRYYPTEFLLEKAVSGGLSEDDYLEWAMCLGRWPDSRGAEECCRRQEKTAESYIHCFKREIRISDCAWKPHSRLPTSSDSMHIDEADLALLDQTVESRFRKLASKMLGQYRPVVKTLLPLRRLYWANTKPPRSRGEDCLTGVVLRQPCYPFRNFFFLYDFEGSGTMIFDFYKGVDGILCLGGLLQDGWTPVIEVDSHPGRAVQVV